MIINYKINEKYGEKIPTSKIFFIFQSQIFLTVPEKQAKLKNLLKY